MTVAILKWILDGTVGERGPQLRLERSGESWRKDFAKHRARGSMLTCGHG